MLCVLDVMHTQNWKFWLIMKSFQVCDIDGYALCVTSHDCEIWRTIETEIKICGRNYISV